MLGEPARFFGKIRPAPRSTQLLHTPPAYHHYEDLTLIRQASSTAETAYGLVQDFLTMVRKRQGEQLDSWIEAVQTSHIPELHRFVAGILKDKDAVVAGLTQIYSNGPVEAQVQKLKLVKRQMFGRAKLPLLRRRLLNAL